MTSNPMTQAALCEWLLTFAKEYPDKTKSEGVRCFDLGPLQNVPDCGCNGRPPAFHAIVYPDLPAYLSASEGRVEFEVFGQAGDGRWLQALIYSVLRDEVVALLPDVRAAATAVWTAFVASLNVRAMRRAQEELAAAQLERDRLRSVLDTMATTEGYVGFRVEFPSKDRQVMTITGPTGLEEKIAEALVKALKARKPEAP